jgi:hypothetical protein
MNECARVVSCRRANQLLEFLAQPACLLRELAKFCVDPVFGPSYFFHGVFTHTTPIPSWDGCGRGISSFRANHH